MSPYSSPVSAAQVVVWRAAGKLLTEDEQAGVWGWANEQLRLAVAQREVLCFEAMGDLYFPVELALCPAQVVVTVCRTLPVLPSSQRLAFWLAGHPALKGRTPREHLTQNGTVEALVALAATWRGPVRGATDADSGATAREP